MSETTFSTKEISSSDRDPCFDPDFEYDAPRWFNFALLSKTSELLEVELARQDSKGGPLLHTTPLSPSHQNALALLDPSSPSRSDEELEKEYHAWFQKNRSTHEPKKPIPPLRPLLSPSEITRSKSSNRARTRADASRDYSRSSAKSISAGPKPTLLASSFPTLLSSPSSPLGQARKNAVLIDPAELSRKRPRKSRGAPKISQSRTKGTTLMAVHGTPPVSLLTRKSRARGRRVLRAGISRAGRAGKESSRVHKRAHQALQKGWEGDDQEEGGDDDLDRSLKMLIQTHNHVQRGWSLHPGKNTYAASTASSLKKAIKPARGRGEEGNVGWKNTRGMNKKSRRTPRKALAGEGPKAPAHRQDIFPPSPFSVPDHGSESVHSSTPERQKSLERGLSGLILHENNELDDNEREAVKYREIGIDLQKDVERVEEQRHNDEDYVHDEEEEQEGEEWKNDDSDEDRSGTDTRIYSAIVTRNQARRAREAKLTIRAGKNVDKLTVSRDHQEEEEEEEEEDKDADHFVKKKAKQQPQLKQKQEEDLERAERTLQSSPTARQSREKLTGFGMETVSRLGKDGDVMSARASRSVAKAGLKAHGNHKGSDRDRRRRTRGGRVRAPVSVYEDVEPGRMQEEAGDTTADLAELIATFNRKKKEEEEELLALQTLLDSHNAKMKAAKIQESDSESMLGNSSSESCHLEPHNTENGSKQYEQTNHVASSEVAKRKSKRVSSGHVSMMPVDGGAFITHAHSRTQTTPGNHLNLKKAASRQRESIGKKEGRAPKKLSRSHVSEASVDRSVVAAPARAFGRTIQGNVAQAVPGPRARGKAAPVTRAYRQKHVDKGGSGALATVHKTKRTRQARAPKGGSSGGVGVEIVVGGQQADYALDLQRSTAVRSHRLVPPRALLAKRHDGAASWYP